MRIKKKLFLTTMLVTWIPSLPAWSQMYAAENNHRRMETLPLTLIDHLGKAHRLKIEVARTEFEQKKGLANRSDMPSDSGMLFLFDPTEPVTMWMRDTAISLDMVFIGPDRRITFIAEHTVPFSEALIAGRGNSRAVLEVKAGTMQKMGITVGDKVESEALTETTLTSDPVR